MTKAEARLIETLADDAWIALAYDLNTIGACAILEFVQKEFEVWAQRAKTPNSICAALRTAFDDLEKRISTAVQIVARIREAAREELKNE
jgi:hypothetical protein